MACFGIGSNNLAAAQRPQNDSSIVYPLSGAVSVIALAILAGSATLYYINGIDLPYPITIGACLIAPATIAVTFFVESIQKKDPNPNSSGRANHAKPLVETPKSPSILPPPKHTYRQAGFSPRTIAMQRHLQQVPLYRRSGNNILFKGQKEGGNVKKYAIVDHTSSMFNDYLASCGSSSHREMLLLDPNSKRVKQFYADFVKNVPYKEIEALGSADISKKLKLLMNALQSHMSQTFNSGSEKRVNALVAKISRDPDCIKIQGQPYIFIDDFIEARAGVCRHHALLCCHLLYKYISEHGPSLGLEQLKIQHMRDNVKGGAHAWVTIVTGNDTFYSVDTLNNLNGDLSHPLFRALLEHLFGTRAVVNQIKKAKKHWDMHQH